MMTAQHLLRRPPSPSFVPNRSSRCRAGQRYRQTAATLPDSIVFADAFVRFAFASRAKSNVAHDMPKIIQPKPGRRLSTDTRLITSHDGVDLPASLFQQPRAATALPPNFGTAPDLFPSSIRFARRFHLRRFQHAARKGEFLDFVFPRLHFLEQSPWRRSCFHARRHATRSAVRRHFAFNFASMVTFIAPQFATGFSFAEKCRRNFACSIIRIPVFVPVCATTSQNHFPRRTRCGSACTLSVESPAAPGPSSRAPRTSAFQFPTERIPPSRYSSFRQRHSRELRRRNMRQKCSRINIYGMSPRRLHDRNSFTRNVVAGEMRFDAIRYFKYSLVQRLVQSHRNCFQGRVPPVRRTLEILRSKSADPFPVAPAGRRWCREIRRCSPCRLFFADMVPRRNAKIFRAQFSRSLFA